MKNLITRTITGAVFIASIILSAIYSPLLFAILFFIMAMVAMWEFQRLNIKTLPVTKAFPGIMTAVITYAVVALYALTRLGAEALWLIPAASLVLILIHLFSAGPGALKTITVDLLGVVMVVFPLALLNIFLNPSLVPAYHTPWFVLGMFLILWTHDTFAYLTGSLFGKHPLSPKISPKKSIEGSIGGFGFSLIAAYIISIFSPELNLWLWIGIAVIIAVFGTLGDLAESLLKRNAGLKDSGNILPGHGGMLDRFDSVFFVSPIVLILILLSIS